MAGSRMIRVLKRDSSTEPFDSNKLRLSLWRAMKDCGGKFTYAHCLSQAIDIYLEQTHSTAVSSRAILEMAVRALRQTDQHAAAEVLETHHRWRQAARRRLTMVHESGQKSVWDRNWVTQQAEHRWSLSHGTARGISADIESELLPQGGEIRREQVLDRLDELVDQLGLAPWCLMASVPSL